jgi:uncharacterized protein (DUF1015 family)
MRVDSSAMAQPLNDVRALRGLSFDPARVGRVADCLAHPYDVISPEEQAAYLAKHPFNIVHLTLGAARPSDGEEENVYSRARRLLEDWTAQGVLAPSAPSVWLYEQRFEMDGRALTTRGILAVVRLRDFSERRVLPHEKVMAGPVEDRMRLTLATEAQLEPIWGFYRQPGPDLAPLASGPPQVECEDSGVRHRVWRVSDPAACRELAEAAGRGEIFIADGHHRYTTMLKVRDQMRRRHPGAGPDAPWEFILMFLVNADREPLTILPYHRVVSGRKADGALMTRLERRFAIRRVDDWRGALAAAGREARAFALAAAGEPVRLLVHGGGGERLDVELLNDLVLRDGLGLTEEDLARGRGVEYTHDPGAALAAVAAGRAQMAFLMNPTRLEEIERCARSGGAMPRKSSFFYPKPLSGIVVYPMRTGS